MVNSPSFKLSLGSGLLFARRQSLAHLALLLGLAGAFVSSPVYAQAAGAPSAEDKAGARAAANAGADAFDAGDFVKAADFFNRAEGIIHSPVHELYIARSYAQVGRLVEARELLLKIQRADENAKITKSAGDELKKVEARLPRVALEVSGADGAQLQVTVDNKAFRSTLLGIAQPFDPGEHTAVVKVAGKESVTHTFTVPEGETKTVTMDVSQAATVAPVAATKKEEPAETTPENTVQDTGGVNGLRIGGYVALGVGAVGIGVGTFFAIEAGNLASDRNSLCNKIDALTGTTDCSGRTAEEEIIINDYEQDHNTARTTAIVGFAVGGAAVAAGVTMLILSASGKKQSVSFRNIEVHPTLGYKYVGLMGSF